jgi:hypothetical protein
MAGRRSAPRAANPLEDQAGDGAIRRPVKDARSNARRSRTPVGRRVGLAKGITAELGERWDPSVFSMRYTDEVEKPKIEHPMHRPIFPQALARD